MKPIKEQRSSYDHILKYTGLLGGIQGLGIAVSLVRNKLVAVLLGPEGMGLISLFNSTIKLISDSTNLGISVSSVRNLSEAYEKGDEDKLRRQVLVARSWGLLTALAGVLIFMLAGPLLNKGTFSWGDHTMHYILLSPVVGMMAITGVEMAILKSTGKLGSLAMISIYNMIASLVISIPLFYLYGMSGIVPSIVLFTFVQMITTLAYSYRLFPLKFS